MKRAAFVLLLVALLAAPSAGADWYEIPTGWREISSSGAVPATCITPGMVPFLGSPVSGGYACDAGLTYDASTNALSLGAIANESYPGTVRGRLTNTRPSDNSATYPLWWPAPAGRTYEAPFGMMLGGATFEGEWDPVMYFGYNPNRTVATEPSFTFNIEGNYKHGRRDLEAYFEYVTPAGAGWRPMSLFKDKSEAAINGDGIGFDAEYIYQNAVRAAPLKYMFNPWGANQPALIGVNGGSGGAGDKQFIRMSGGYDRSYAASLAFFGDACTSVEGAKGAAYLFGGHPADAPTPGSMQGAVGIFTGVYPGTERVRVEYDGNVVLGNPGVAGAALLDVNGSIRGKSVQLVTGSRPTCDASTRGLMFYVAGSAGAADTCEVCRKDASDNYAWVSLF